jgi:hypothetical protein
MSLMNPNPTMKAGRVYGDLPEYVGLKDVLQL